MDGIRFRSGRRAPHAAGLVLILAAFVALPETAFAGRPPLVDAPIAWEDRDREDVPAPAGRDPNLLWDGVQETLVRPTSRFFDPGTLVRRAGVPFGGDHVPAAADVNAIDEVPNSSWFTNRIGLHPLSLDEAAAGSGPGVGPSREAVWTVVGAKTEGVTPGFTIQDVTGARYLIKFDPPGHLGMSSGAGAICARLMHAAGYFVPDDVVVTFRRADLSVSLQARIADPKGQKRPMVDEDLDRVLAGVECLPDGSWLAIASRFLPGTLLGPFDYAGRRRDDPNDRVRHENRRELRGFRIFAAWLNHFDTKQHNTLDTWVEDGGRHHVRHHLIDFASTLGGGASGPQPRYGREYTVDLPAILGRVATLGLREDRWRRVSQPESLPEIGYLETTEFSSLDFRSFEPNAAFANLTDRDGYWAAKIISAFSDDHLRAVVATARYPHAEASEFMWKALAARRDLIAREWFDRVPPLDFFHVEEGRLRWHDLGAERGIYPGTTAKYVVRVAAVDAGRDEAGWSEPRVTAGTEMMLAETEAEAEAGSGGGAGGDAKRDPFLAIRIAVDRGEGPGREVACYVARKSDRVVAVDH